MTLKKFFCIIIFLNYTCRIVCAQQTDSIRNIKDSSHFQTHSDADSIVDFSNANFLHPTKNGYEIIDSLLKQNKFCSIQFAPVAVPFSLKKNNDPGFVFYLLLGTAILLGLMKTVFYKYFTNLLRVFFNTSLRQSQLTDQLLQSRLPEFMFSIAFYLTGGQYIYQLLNKTGHIHGDDTSLMMISIVALTMIYLFKFAAIRMIGWVTGYRSDAQLYQFIVSITNNILTVILLPLLFLMAFSEKWLSDLAVNFSYVLIALIFLFRYFRAFGNLQKGLKMSSFHFILYVIALEIIPLLLLYKIGWNILTNYM